MVEYDLEDDLDTKLKHYFDGKIVRKDLTTPEIEANWRKFYHLPGPGWDDNLEFNIFVRGINAYGYLKHERGVHRLVRISPFDSNKRRHTSFASVLVTPKFDDNIDIVINDNDIRVDIFRSSGPGGQGVNTTDSAVRITHIPTGIVVTCQNERSQIRNKEICLEVLKNKLYSIELEKKNDKLNDIKGNMMSIGFGSGKRSYVMCPYTLVKDNDSGYESSNVEAILDGDIGEMLEKNIRR